MAGRLTYLSALLAALLVAAAPLSPTPLLAAESSKAIPDDLLDAIVSLRITVPAEARSSASLGTTRAGTGIVIDTSGLILTIGYLMMEASGAEVTAAGKTYAATVVGYDHETGFGLLRTTQPIPIRPLRLGSARDIVEKQPLIAAAAGAVQPVLVVSKRRYAAYWEYMLDNALFTSPPIANFGGAALIDSGGRLVGVGSLIVSDAGSDPKMPGNMFVPIDLLRPIMADLLTQGRRTDPGRPWLGMSTQDRDGRLIVASVAKESPAEKAGIVVGDVVTQLNGRSVSSLPDLYTRLWSMGPAGTEVPLTLQSRSGGMKEAKIKSINRMDFLKFESSY